MMGKSKKGKKEADGSSSDIEKPTSMNYSESEGHEINKMSGKDSKVDVPKKKKGPGKAMVSLMQEALKKKKEEEERFEKEENERIKLLEEAEKLRDEKARLEQEKKDRKKQKEKERKERLKAEGKLLTAKQRADKARAEAMIESLKAQGVSLPGNVEKRMRPGTRVRVTKQNKSEAVKELHCENETDTTVVNFEKLSISEESIEKQSNNMLEDIKEAWDATSSDEDNGTDCSVVSEILNSSIHNTEESEKLKECKKDSSLKDFENLEESKEMRECSEAELRIKKRELEAEKNRSLDKLRSAVVCVLGHVDVGKTKILDKLRRTNVQDNEAGGITQAIGATNVPIDNIKDSTKHINEYSETVFRIPGILIIDTPGHESFNNLRSRGSSLCDIAILVVDIMHGLEPQTIESLNILRSRKTPFVVALNKIDRLYEFCSMPRKDIREIIKSQQLNTQQEFEKRTKDVIAQFAQEGLNASLFYDNPDPRYFISMVPVSAVTGEGLGNLLMLIVQYSQNQLAKRLMYSETLQATVLEVKAISGLGTTLDVILINGKLKEGDTVVLAGTEGPIVTQIKALLMPQPMKELRVKNAYIEYKEIFGAQGVKIAGKELDKAIAGINLQVAQKPDEIEIYKNIVTTDLKLILRSIRLSDQGVFVQASTLGSLEALLEFLKTSKIPYAGIRIGAVVKRDVMRAACMLEHQSEYATILAFDVKIERDAQDLADHVGVKIFHADIIYHLFDKFTAYREELMQQKREQFKSVAVFPCKLKILPQFVFNSRDPIVMGVTVEAGIIKEGTPICVPSKGFEDLGLVSSIESNHKNVPSARKGMEVCIKIDAIPGTAPKMYGRHFDETDILCSKISRQSIDACKEFFRDDLLKSDWALMVDLKKLFKIL